MGIQKKEKSCLDLEIMIRMIKRRRRRRASSFIEVPGTILSTLHRSILNDGGICAFFNKFHVYASQGKCLLA